jgi:hypothetical protein
MSLEFGRSFPITTGYALMSPTKSLFAEPSNRHAEFQRTAREKGETLNPVKSTAVAIAVQFLLHSLT